MQNADLRTLLSQVSQIFPATGLIVVGVDSQFASDLAGFLGVDSHFFIDPAEPVRSNKVQLSSRQPVEGVVALADRSGSEILYRANGSAFSGLARPETLQKYWQNLKTVERVASNVITLDEYCQTRFAPVEIDKVNWLVLNIISSGVVLSGAPALLRTIDAVNLRALVDPNAPSELQGCTLEYVQAMLEPMGFKLVHQASDRHPAFVSAVFVKDWKALSTAHLNAAKLTEERLQSLQVKFDDQGEKVSALSKQRDELESITDALQSKLAQFETAAIATRNSIKTLSQENKKLTKKVIDQTTKLARNETKTKAAERAEKSALAERAGVLTSIEARISQASAARTQIQETVAKIETALDDLNSEIRDARYLQFAGLTKRKQNLIDQLIIKADSAYHRTSYKRAAEYYQAVLQQDKSNAWSMQGLAESLARMDYDNDPNWFSQDRADLIEKTGKWDVTVRLYRAALKLDPNISLVFNERFLQEESQFADSIVENPVFVAGCGHSGTSLMIKIISSHPNFFAIPKESAAFLVDDAKFRYRMHQWDQECSALKATRWVEKTPPHIFQIQRFLALRPKAQFIIMIRDGRDVVCSLRKRAGYENIEDRLDRWTYDNLSAMPFWDHPQVRVVRYEALVAAPEETIKGLCAFLNEPMSDSMLEYHKTETKWYSARKTKPRAIKNHADHLALRNWQINQPIFDGRDKWKTDMSTAEKSAFKRSAAQQLLERLGYVEGHNW